MVVGYSDPIDGCTDGSSYRENPDELKMAVVDDNAVVQKETSLIQNNVPAKIVDICSRTTADKDKDVETTVDVYSSSEESTAECESSSEDGDGVLDLAKNNQNNQMVNQMKECKDFMVAANVHITNNYPSQPLSLDVEQLKNLADGSVYKSLWADDANLDESIEKAQAKVSYPFIKALAMAVTTTLVLVIVVVGLLLWQMKISDSEGSIDSGCVELVRRKDWGDLEPKNPSTPLKVIPPKFVIVAHTDGPTCASSSECRETVRNIQISEMSRGASDISFNFLVGGDCKIYEGVGWNKTGNHTLLFNEESIGLAFIGTFMVSPPPQAQVDAGLSWLEQGVASQNLDPEYVVYVQKQVTPFESPGVQMIPFIKKWDHWSDNVTVRDVF